MGCKAGFPKNQSKLHFPVYAAGGVKTPEERALNKRRNHKKMMFNRITRRRRAGKD